MSAVIARLNLALVLSCTLALPIARAADDTDAELRALREQIRLLDERLRQLEQNQRAKEKESAAAAAPAPKVNLTDKGLSFASADGANTVRLGGIVQLDSRVFFGDGGGIANNSFVLRRARLISEGTFDRIFSYQLVPELAGSSATVLDANLTIAPSSLLQFKAGRFKVPVGLELVQSDTATFFTERSLVTNLVPNRDLGIQVGGAWHDGVVSYALGLFNGVADAASTSNVDFDSEKDLAGRVFFQPFHNDAESPLRGLGVGVSASVGREKGTAGVAAGYKTDGQQTFFRYNSPVLADGRVWRLSPQGYLYHGPFGLLGEYVVSTVNARPSPGAAKSALRQRAWQLAAGYVLTGEESTFAAVIPRQPFNWSHHTWGAWQIVARYGDLRIDPDAFPLFAAPSINAAEASAIGLGVNWYLSRTVRTSLDYFQTRFTNPVALSTQTILRQDEEALITRLQIAF